MTIPPTSLLPAHHAARHLALPGASTLAVCGTGAQAAAAHVAAIRAVQPIERVPRRPPAPARSS